MRKESVILGKVLQNAGLTLALAESVTCGLAAHQLSLVRGTMDIFKGCIVCYSPEVKTTLLGVSRQLLLKKTAESAEVTDALASNLHRVIKADIYAATTGLSAPGGSENGKKPVGTIYLSVMYRGKVHRHRQVFKGTSLEIKKKACNALFRLIAEVVANNSR